MPIEVITPAPPWTDKFANVTRPFLYGSSGGDIDMCSWIISTEVLKNFQNILIQKTARCVGICFVPNKAYWNASVNYVFIGPGNGLPLFGDKFFFAETNVMLNQLDPLAHNLVTFFIRYKSIILRKYMPG